MTYTEHQIYLFFLILVRVSSMFMVAPVFSFRGVPVRLKVGLAGLMALLLFPVVDAGPVNLEFNHLTAVILVFQEIVTGLSIGFVMSLLFAGIEMAGEFISLDMGFTMAQIFDPNFNHTVSVIGRTKNVLAVLIFLIIDGHHFLIEAVAYSYRILPLGSWGITSLAVDKMIHLTAQVFVIGIKVAAPAVVALFLTTVTMGIVARAVPQMNIFFVGFPLRITVGLLFFGFGFPIFLYLFRVLLDVFQEDTLALLKVL